MADKWTLLLINYIIREGGKFVKSALADKGLVYLGAVHNGLRQFSNSKRDIKSPADMKNLKIRVMGSEIYLDIFSALGADPVGMSWSEVYTALQQGTIDGQDKVEAQEEEMIKEFVEKCGVTVAELTEEELQVFKKTLEPVIAKYKAQYGEEACVAFDIK